MTVLYIIQNQHQHFLSKQGEWLDGSESASIYRTEHKDEAINLKVEHAVRQPELRLKIVTCTANEKGRLQLDATTPPSASTSIDSTPDESFTSEEQPTENATPYDSITSCESESLASPL